MNVSVETKETTKDEENPELTTNNEAPVVSGELKETTTEDSDEPGLTNSALPTIVGLLSDEPGEADTQDAGKPEPTASTTASAASGEPKGAAALGL